ncbi:hypothetical protein ACWDR9_12835 [Streptosporangium sandarakinum]
MADDESQVAGPGRPAYKLRPDSRWASALSISAGPSRPEFRAHCTQTMATTPKAAPTAFRIRGSSPGRVPEGRIGFAENAPVKAPWDRRHTDHPNGATRLVECVLCVADTALPESARRYESYFGRARHGRVTRFGRANVTVVAASALAGLLPGERPAALPAFVAYAVAVRDLSATEELLRDNDVPVIRTGPEEMFVPAGAALGVAIVFRQDG